MTATRQAANGTTPDTTTFPLESFREAAPYLRRPFTAAAIKFKVQATWDGGALIVGYIDARLAVERLNLIVPHLWHDAYRPIGNGQMWCDLTIDEITRSDVGEGTGKGLVSDALKRAAVKFGVGVSLYAIPKMIVNERDGHLKQGKRDKYEMTPTGEKRVRDLYEAWLNVNGTGSFGDPLDHGDVEGAQGDADAEPPAPPAAEEPVVVLATPEDVETLKSAAKGLKVGQIRLALGSVGAPVADGAPVTFDHVPAAVVKTLDETLSETART